MSVLIVGAGPGMGAALAHALGSQDKPVALIGRDSQTTEAIVDDLAAAGITAKAALAEVGDPEQLRSAIGGVCAEVGPAEVAVFNASAYVDGPPSSVDIAEFTEGLSVGITGALVTLQAVVEPMRSRGGGTILFTGGSTALDPWTAACGLSAQKAAMRNLAYAAADELRDDNIHACTITIMGALKRDSPFDPRLIAAKFAEVAARPMDQWQPEVRYEG